MEEQRLTHVGSDGRASMVDVGGKPTTERRAVAESRVTTSLEVLQLIERGDAPKGAVLSTAEIAGVQAAKRTAEPFDKARAVTAELYAAYARGLPPGPGQASSSPTARPSRALPTGAKIEMRSAVPSASRG